tara:strand:+ start:1154 stop:1258 length:105 start_codon:yes stop_codon:yes gene_type:complete
MRRAALVASKASSKASGARLALVILIKKKSWWVN